MKYLIFLLLTSSTVSFINAQKLNESQVPSAVKSTFKKKYPSVKASWDKEDANYEANFKENGTAMSTVIDKNGTIVETEADIPVTDLPKMVRDYMKKNYPAIRMGEAARIVKANGDINYETEVHHKDILFDAEGKFIKEVKD